MLPLLLKLTLSERYPLDNIKVTETKPLFSAAEAASAISKAENEGVDKNEFKSGKYQLAGDWLSNLPETRAWFNKQLQTTFFPLLANLFPEIISSPSVIRAHSVSLLKCEFNVVRSHIRTSLSLTSVLHSFRQRKSSSYRCAY